MNEQVRKGAKDIKERKRLSPLDSRKNGFSEKFTDPYTDEGREIP